MSNTTINGPMIGRNDSNTLEIDKNATCSKTLSKGPEHLFAQEVRPDVYRIPKHLLNKYILSF